MKKGELFAGLAPKLAYELCVIFFSNSLVHLYNDLKTDDLDETVDKLLPSLINMAVSTREFRFYVYFRFSGSTTGSQPRSVKLT